MLFRSYSITKIAVLINQSFPPSSSSFPLDHSSIFLPRLPITRMLIPGPLFPSSPSDDLALSAPPIVNDQQSILHSKNFGGTSDECEDDIGEKSEEPKLGMEFISTADAYNYYTSYAGKLGFNVRKSHHIKNKNGLITRVSFCCSRQGFRQPNKISESASYRKPVTRVGCLAEMSCLLVKNGKYKIVSCCTIHNHELICTPMKHILKINRSISEAQKSRTDDADKSGISIKATIELMSTECGGRENVGFTDQDYRNYIHSKRKLAMGKGDAGAILHYFDKMKSQDPSYFSSIQLDEADMITNMFWADARSVSDYGIFGDVVCFDTTYRTNEYGRPFAPFVGVNHHKQTVIFGAALLYDETIDSFIWLFKTFLNAMNGKKPITILTDQSAAMANAISQVFCGTRHRLCVWHIYQNAAKHLSHVFNRSKEFVKDFSKCMYDFEDEDEWLVEWSKMLETYNLKDNDWLKSQFELKEKWAMVYGRHTFTADMKSTQRSECMNSVMKKYLNPSLDFLRFFEHFERVLKDRRYEELLADFKMMSAKPVMVINTGMLQHGVEVYTPEMFKLFQAEYTKILNYDTWKINKDSSTSTYKVCYTGTSKEHFVTFEVLTQTITCSCMKFTFLGILCAHALKVLDKKNVKYIPPQYIKQRWSRHAKARSISNYDDVNINDDPKESIGRRYSHLCRNFRDIATYASEHDKLTAYAHECLVHLLKNLEEMKKVYSKGISVHNHVNVPLDEIVVMTPAGVKRKATVGRPKGRIKDPLEKRRSKTKDKIVKATNKESSSSLNIHDGTDFEHERQAFDGLVEYQSFNANVNFPEHFSFRQLLQSSISNVDYQL